MPHGREKWTPAPPCRPGMIHRAPLVCVERREHEMEALAVLGMEDDGTFFLVDDTRDEYVCEVMFCPWCGRKLRSPKPPRVGRGRK